MIAVVRGNITNLRVNFAGSRPATKLLVAKATSVTGLVNKSRGNPGSTQRDRPIKPANLLNRGRKMPSTHLGNRPPTTKSP
jgi:hypothetical protein